MQFLCSYLPARYFWIIATPAEDVTAGMYHVKCIYHEDRLGQNFHPGSIIPLTAVTCAIELIPVYGSKMNHMITAANVMEICDEYYLNAFSDKEVFHTMHFGLM
ncbi:hypothetical protein BDR04DRAFT_1206935 [Suillus decipiens]|nr:hypothetical protein BDR04DRAFT_1206935 [Suillus decipiens]